MKKTLGYIFAVAGFLGFFCEASSANLQILTTGCAIAAFLLGAWLLGAFDENSNLNTISK